MNVWGDECRGDECLILGRGYWMSEVMNVWGDECLILCRGWWMSEVMNVQGDECWGDECRTIFQNNQTVWRKQKFLWWAIKHVQLLFFGPLLSFWFSLWQVNSFEIWTTNMNLISKYRVVPINWNYLDLNAQRWNSPPMQNWEIQFCQKCLTRNPVLQSLARIP